MDGASPGCGADRPEGRAIAKFSTKYYQTFCVLSATRADRLEGDDSTGRVSDAENGALSELIPNGLTGSNLVLKEWPDGTSKRFVLSGR